MGAFLNVQKICNTGSINAVISVPGFRVCFFGYFKVFLRDKRIIMKSFCSVLFFSFLFSAATAQTTDAVAAKPDETKAIQLVEVSCGKCKLGLPGKSCDLAVRINDKAYYVDGADIDNYGDAHAHDGMCNAIRKAEVQGELVDNRFKITYIKLLPAAKEDIKH